ncbi:MAG: FkbM family methyltransferase, partial [Pirellula sp.]
MNNKHRNWPNWTVGLRDTLFRLACLNRGFPVRLGDETFRIDESLRRHKIDSDDFLFVALKNTLRPGDVFVDVGANIGLYSLAASPLVEKTGVVQSFEPDPTNLALLSRNIYLNSLGSTVIAQGVALSETSNPSTLEFFVPLDGKGSPESSLQPGSKPMKKVEVPTTTLDEFVESFGRVPTLI